MNEAIKRGAYGGIVGLVLILPMLILEEMSLHGLLSSFGITCFVVLMAVAGFATLVSNYGVIKVAEKHAEKYLLWTSWAVLICAGLSTFLHISYLLDPQVKLIGIARYSTVGIETIILFLQAFAFARLSLYYGEMALRLRDFQVVLVISAWVVFIGAFFSLYRNPQVLLLMLILLVVAGVSSIASSLLGIKLLFRAANASYTAPK